MSLRDKRVAMLSLHSCPAGRPGTKDTGGMSVYVHQLSRHLGMKSISVDIFTSHYEPEGPQIMELGENVRLIHLPCDSPLPAGKISLYSYLSDLSCAIHGFANKKGVTYDLVHSHYWLSGIAGKTLAGWWGIKHMTMLHTSALAKNRALGLDVETELRSESEKEVLQSASLIVAATETEKHDLIELYSALPDKIVVIPCGVDLEMFQPHPKDRARQVIGLNSQHIVLYVGRMEVGKGIEVLLKAVASMDGKENVMMILVGGGDEDREYKEQLRLYSKKLGISVNICFHSAVEQSELPTYYSAADICVMPSYYETFGLTAIESLACGTPVVASRVGIVADGNFNEAVIMLDKHSPEHLAAILGQVLRNGKLLREIRYRARPSVLGMGWALVADRIAAEYDRLLVAS